MKVVVLAGGLGSRISEETDLKPKPMVEIGGRPILWHIMKMYSAYGYNEFVICLGYKGYIIKEYFANYFLHLSDIEVDLTKNSIHYINSSAEPWKISLIDTGADVLTGGRLKRIAPYINETFMMTYGDGVSDININSLIETHKEKACLATITAVQPPGRFGSLDISGGNKVSSFVEKPLGQNAWINGGFFVLEPEVLDYIDGDDTAWEDGPLQQLATEDQLVAFHHRGFWRPMDTLRDKRELEEMLKNNKAPWVSWAE